MPFIEDIDESLGRFVPDDELSAPESKEETELSKVSPARPQLPEWLGIQPAASREELDIRNLAATQADPRLIGGAMNTKALDVNAPTVNISPQAIRMLQGPSMLLRPYLPEGVQQFMQGAEESAAEMASGMTSPKSVAMAPAFAVPVLGPALAGYMGAEAIGAGAGELVAGAEMGDPSLMGRGAVNTVAGLTMAIPGAAGLKRAVTPATPVPPAIPAAAELFSRTESVLPRSTEAARAVVEKPMDIPAGERIAAIDQQLAAIEQEFGPRFVMDPATKKPVSNPNTIRPRQEAELLKLRDELSPQQAAPEVPKVAEAPAAEVPLAERVGAMSPSEFFEATRTGELKGGMTERAFELGKTVKTPEELARLRELESQAQAQAREAMARSDVDALQGFGMKKQFFTEAIEQALGVAEKKTTMSREAYDAAMKGELPSPAIENLSLLSESNLGRASAEGKVPTMLLPDGTALIGESHPTIIAKYETLNPGASTEGAISGFTSAGGTFTSSPGWPESTSPIKRVQRPQSDLRGPVPTEARDIQTVESELRGLRALTENVKRDAEHEHYFQRLDELEAELKSKQPEGGVARETLQGQEKVQKEILAAESGQRSPPQETAPSLTTEATTATPVAGSSQSLGIVPPGAQQLQSIIDAAIAKPQGVDSPVRTDVTTPLPDFQPHANSKKIFSQPFGFERLPVLGALWGGLRRLKGNVNEAITAYHGERNVGRAVASALAQEYSWLKKPFTIKDGQIANIGAAEGQSRYISDVFEALQRDPNAYQLTPEQRAAFDAMQKLEGDFKKLEQKYGLSKAIEEEGGVGTEGGEGRSYFPRVVVEAPEGRGRTLGTGAKVGGKAFFEKSRLFETEAEGWQKGWKYEEDITRRIATRAERLYKRIADKRLADDPTLGGLSRKELDAQLKDGYAEELASGEITEAKLQQIGDSIEQQGRVWQPQFFNKIFPRETAEAMNKAFPQTQSGLRSMAASANSALKGLWLGFDLGAGFIQGQGIMFYQPKVWARAQVNSLKSMVSPEFFPEYVRRNLEPIREMAQLGSSVGRMEEMLAGAERGELLQRIPGVKQTLGKAIQPFARQFQTFIDTAKVELWKGLRDTTPQAEWPRVMQSIESVLSTSRMEAIGIGAGRALTERAATIAPSYYRGALNLVAGMGEKGVSGQVARRAMGAYMAGGALLYYGIGKALGMSDEDLLKRFDPRRSDFMLWRVKTGERTTEIGFGGIFKSLMKLGGNIIKTSIEHPENWKSLAPEKNPITRWYRGHAGPAVGLVWDQFSGRDFMGQEANLGDLSKVPLPMVARTAMTEGQRFSPLDTAATFAGLTAFERTNPSSQEINKLASAYRKKAGLPDTADFVTTETPARKVREALQQRDTKAAMAALQELRKTKKDPDIFKGFQQSRTRAFTGSAEREGKFKATLTPQQRALYDSAKAEKERDYQAFLDLWRNKPPR